MKYFIVLVVLLAFPMASTAQHCEVAMKRLLFLLLLSALFAPMHAPLHAQNDPYYGYGPFGSGTGFDSTLVTYTSGDYQIIGLRGLDTSYFAFRPEYFSFDGIPYFVGMPAYVSSIGFQPFDNPIMIKRNGEALTFNAPGQRSAIPMFLSLSANQDGTIMRFLNNDYNTSLEISSDYYQPGCMIDIQSDDPTAHSDISANHPLRFYVGDNYAVTLALGEENSETKSRFAVWKGDGMGKIFSIDPSGNVTIGFTNNHLTKREHMLNVSGTGKFDSSLIALGDVSGATFNGVKVYRAFLTQTGTSAPTATILENSLGAIVWARADTGTYTATLSNAFTANKTWAENKIISASTGAVYDIVRTSASVMTITTRQMPGAAARKDALLSSTVLEIRVYP